MWIVVVTPGTPSLGLNSWFLFFTSGTVSWISSNRAESLIIHANICSDDQEKQSKKKPRLFCDICDCFDLHDTEDCPTQAQMSEDPPHSTHHGSRSEERPYCEICEMFGHWATNCNDDETFWRNLSWRPGLSDGLAHGRPDTSLVCADCGSTHVIFHPHQQI